jgi:hypothetical protein
MRREFMAKPTESWGRVEEIIATLSSNSLLAKKNK